ncbi:MULTISPECIES: Gfo/Idh/MocA family oxidoreductase [unclassified Streptomyces]|uniref:Gfo/Idh/MocA family protein n=1 Tax=unclassified Streptomyces TaxID=2593676 RepID=UPI002E2C7776|nr:Gfo/Idh/MocA family oxidoreductase [Streptomyces sp. NBC_01423]WSX90632.1 Gfo/Idh/MocA family oxidoreductase [Streptomyces sp. NBC_00891]WSY05113.1 Gfo/Idh/MocA family oxidoreductase [Streptomyces sp. NBC_00890]WSZ06737.1 Gfo/Idh/MocA family oxidoreductase [Streptomyces sp. NBC_00869]WSZ25764.1 Gfo/Idh/MocA family oxidoreductase [Streptomyces sp. NBC_00870]
MTTPETPLRVGLAGTGPWARNTHAPALAAHPGVVLSGVWGRRAEAAEELAGEYGAAAFSGDAGLDELFAVSDAVAFALPPDVQAPLAARAAAAGCHLIMDKPVATTVAGAREVAEAAEQARVASVVFCTLRFAPQTAAWIAEQSAVGDWFTARADWIGALWAPGSDSEYAASPWRRERGGLWDVGPHALSVLIPLLGDVTGLTAARGPSDVHHLVLRHTSGASSTVTLSLGAPMAAAGVEVVLRGEHGIASLPGWDGAVDAFAAAVDALIASVRTGEAHPCDVRFGLRLTELLAEAEAQARSGAGE